MTSYRSIKILTNFFIVLLLFISGIVKSEDGCLFNAKLHKHGVQFQHDTPERQFVLSFPKLQIGNSDRIAPSGVEINGLEANLSYPGNGKIKFILEKSAVYFTFLSVPRNLKSFRFDVGIPLSFGDVSAWKISDKSGTFPRNYEKTKLYQGNAGDFALDVSSENPVFIKFPESFAWMELQDLREWNTHSYSLAVITPFNADKRIIVVPFSNNEENLDGIRSKTEAAFFRSSAGAQSAEKPSFQFSAGMSDGGFSFNCGPMGVFSLSYPLMNFDGGDIKAKPVEKHIQGKNAELKFKNNGAIDVSFGTESFEYKVVSEPAGLRSTTLEMYIPFNFNQGGTWSTDSESGDFPQQKPAEGKVFMGHSKSFSIADVNKSKLFFELPENTYVEFRDNREWGWNVFYVSFTIPYGGKSAVTKILFENDSSEFEQAKLVDEYGQVPRDFPGKIKNTDELLADAKVENEFYNSLTTLPKLNKYGGLEGSGKKHGLKSTGFFHVENKPVDGKDRWILVDPSGDAFFHLGICAFGPSDDFTNVEGRRDSFTWLPPHDDLFTAAWKDNPGDWWNNRAVSYYKANVIRKYGPYNEQEHIGRLIDRVLSAGFNSVGAFSGIPSVVHERNFPYASMLLYGNVRSIKTVRGMFDPFDEATPREIDRSMSGYVARNANDPLLIGYFLANEQGLEDIPRAIPQLDGSYACKRKLVDLLEKKYKTIETFNSAWNQNVASFNELNDRGLALTTKDAFADMQLYTEIFLEKYYSIITETFRKYDKNHMLIGNRWQPGTANSETLCKVAGKYMDVISINYYASEIDKGFVSRLYEWTGRKPQMWSEFYFTSTKQSNAGPGGHDLDTQAERGLAYRNYVENSAALGFVVGVEWFTLIDQASTGRFFEGFNGERNNTGLFSMTDRPYKDMLVEMNKTHNVIYDVWLDGAEPFLFDDPRYNPVQGEAIRQISAGREISPIEVNGQQSGYPLRPPERISSKRLVVGRSAEGLEASFKAAWNDDFLFLIFDVADATPMMNKNSPPSLWSGDGVEIFIGSEQFDRGGAMLFTDRQILLGAGGNNQFYVPNVAQQPAIKTEVLQAVNGKGYTMEAAIPWKDLEITPKENMTLLFDISIDNSDDGNSRTAQIVWNGTARNSGDRTAWGRMILVP
jgi:hypothetical protein